MWKKARSPKVILVILVLLFLCILQIFINVEINSASRENSAVTENDVYAFDWIKNNTPSDALFFVSLSDAGQWIPIFTHRRVLIPFGVVTNYTLYDQYYADYDPERYLSVYPTFARDPYSLTCIDFLNYHNVSYVYIGEKTIYDRDRFNAANLLDSPIFKLVFNKGGAYIFEYVRTQEVTVWDDEDFLIGWHTRAGFGGTVDAVSDGGVYKLRTTSGGYAYSTRSLLPNNSQAITYFTVKWRTDNAAKIKIEVLIDGENHILIDRQASFDWTTSVINLKNYAVGEITSLSILVDDDGYSYVDFLRFEQLVPLEG